MHRSEQQTGPPELSDTMLGTIVEDVPDALVIVDIDGVIRRVNAAVTQVFGYRPDELVGEALEILIPEESRGTHVHQMQRFHRRPTSRPMGVGLELSARRKNGTLIPVEVALVPIRHGDGLVAAFVRDASVRRALINRLIAGTELITAMAGGASVQEIASIAARSTRALLGGRASWLLLTEPGSDHLFVVAAAGEFAEALLGRAVKSPGFVEPDTPDYLAEITDVVDSALKLPAALGGGQLLIAQIGHGESFRGAVVVLRDADAEPFSSTNRDMAVQFNQFIGVALDLTDARTEADKVTMMVEHERIAGDLHDTVIQTLFAEGLRLEATARISEGTVQERLLETVTKLDDVIREIRATIFQLQTPAPGGTGLRTELLDIIDHVTDADPIRTHITFSGDFEQPLTLDTHRALLATLRETLTNTVRHAQADNVHITIEIDHEMVILQVSDDGVGAATNTSDGLGLPGLQARAIQLGGSFVVGPGEPCGTMVRLQVPSRP